MILSNPCEINLKKTMIRCIVYKWNDTSSKVDVITTAPSPLGGGQSVKMLIVGKERLEPGTYGYRITASDRLHERMDTYKSGQIRIKKIIIICRQQKRLIRFEPYLRKITNK